MYNEGLNMGAVDFSILIEHSPTIGIVLGIALAILAGFFTTRKIENTFNKYTIESANAYKENADSLIAMQQRRLDSMAEQPIIERLDTIIELLQEKKENNNDR